MITEKENLSQLEKNIIEILKTVFDPEIPVNIYDLGLIYDIKIDKENKVEVVMTLTAPNCPMADEIIEEVNQKVNGMQEVKEAKVELTFDPTWNKDMMTEEALLELGML